MPRDIETILGEYEARRRAMIADFPAEFVFNVKWDSFTGANGTFTATLKAAVPQQIAGAIPIDDPTGTHGPLIFYQIDLADDIGFTVNKITYDIGSSRTLTVRATSDNQVKFARARARLWNSKWSDYTPAASSANAGNLIAVWTYDQTNRRATFFDLLQSDWLVKNYPGINFEDDMVYGSGDVATSIGTVGTTYWRTMQNGWQGVASAAAGSVQTVNNAGGAVRLLTGTTANNATLIVPGQNALANILINPASGSTPSFHAIQLFGFIGSNVKVRWGFGNPSTAAGRPGEGTFFEFVAGTSANFVTVTGKSGVYTVNTSTVPVTASVKWEFLITFDATSANVKFYYRQGKGAAWTLLFTHTNNIPTATLSPFFQVESTTAAQNAIDIYKVTTASAIED